MTGTALLAYLVGSVPWGWLLVRSARGADLRDVGSGSTGATNALRAGGWPVAALTLALDAGKGAAAVALAQAMAPGSIAVPSLSAVCAVAGHVASPWLGLRGGKGVATAAGGLAVLAPAATALSLAAFALSLAASRRVSVGSLAAAGVHPVLSWSTGTSRAAVIASGAIGLVVLWSHRDNLRRLQAGVEPALWGRRR